MSSGVLTCGSTNAGTFSVIVSNSEGSVTSQVALLTVSSSSVGVIAQWNFNSITPDGVLTTGSTSPSTGSGTASLLTGTTSTFATGDTNSDPAGGTDGTTILWDLTDPAQSRPFGSPLSSHTGPLNFMAFSRDGHTLATGSGSVVLWDLTNLDNLRDHAVQQACSITGGGPWPASRFPDKQVVVNLRHCLLV